MNTKIPDQTIKIHEDWFDEDTKTHYVVMDYAEGGSLRSLLITNKLENRDKMQFLKYIQEILDIVRQMHSDDIVHRDIKPDNILFR